MPSLAARILALFIVANSVWLLVFLGQTRANVMSAERAAVETARSSAALTANAVAETILQARGVAQTVERLPGFWDGDDRDRDAILAALAAPQPIFNGLFYYTSDLKQHGASNYQAGAERPDVSGRAYAREAVATGNLAVTGEVLSSLTSDASIVPAAIPMREARSPHRQGFLIASLTLDRFSLIWDEVALPPASNALLVDLREGRILAATPEGVSPVNATIDPTYLGRIRAGGEAGSILGSDGVQYLRASHLVDGTPWAVVVHIPTQVVLGPVRSQAASYALVYLAVTAIIFGLLMLLRRRLVTRLRTLGQAARQWGSGNWAYRAGIEGTDELGRLGAILDQMAARLEVASRQLALRDAERELSLARREALLRVARRFASEADPRRLLTALLDEARAAVNADAAVVYRWDETRSGLVAVRHSLVAPAEIKLVRLSQGVVGLAVDRRESVVVDDHETGGPDGTDGAADPDRRSAIGTPLLQEGQVIGAIGVALRKPDRAFSADDAEVLELLASIATPTLVGLERLATMQAMAETDALTGLANRPKSVELIEQFLHLSARHGQPVSIAVLDLDHFKRVNDRYGHACGDEVLRRLGELLARSFREEDVVARWGGEEFVVAMYGSSKEAGVQRLTGVLDLLRAETFGTHAGAEFRVTCSAGVAEYLADGDDLQALYEAADAALYRAKASGRDRVLAAPGERPDRPAPRGAARRAQ